MNTAISRRRALAMLSATAAGPMLGGSVLSHVARGHQQTPPPYQLDFRHPIDELIGDLVHTERGDPKLESSTPHGHWYSHEVRRNMGSWGPKARHYPPPAGLGERSLSWRRERVIATAGRFIGYAYQHHHIPDWNPPADWPWKKCCAGHNGKGVDCSNFTSFAYNQGLGIKMTSAVGRQSEIKHAVEEGHEPVPIQRIELPQNYAQRSEVLRSGDLVYIRGREDGPITHVVIWVGSCGVAASGVPLVLDSHGSDVKDDNGQPIPCGIHLRPFREKSWYDRCASHAHRIVPDAPG